MTPAQKEQFQGHVRGKIREYAAQVGGVTQAQEDKIFQRVMQRLESGDMARMTRSAAGVILTSREV